MISFKCKKCSSKIEVKQEWLEQGVNKVVFCSNCGNKMKLNLGEALKKPAPNSTVIISSEIANIDPIKFIIKADREFDYLIKNKNQTYKIIFGRNPVALDTNSDELLTINDAYISRIHGVFTILNRGKRRKVTIEDMGSSNGTSLNGELIKKGDIFYVEKGDEVLAGNTTIKLL